MTTTYTPPRLTPLGWLVDEQEWLDLRLARYPFEPWLLIERRHWFESETRAWKFYNDQEWGALENRMIAEAALLQHYKLRTPIHRTALDVADQEADRLWLHTSEEMKL